MTDAIFLFLFLVLLNELNLGGTNYVINDAVIMLRFFSCCMIS